MFTVSSNFTSENTEGFTNSNYFTDIFKFSEDFTVKNDQFSKTFDIDQTETDDSNIESISVTPLDSQKITFSMSFLLTYIQKRSVSFSLSFTASNLYSISYNFDHETYEFVILQSFYLSHYPYIIYYMSPSYTMTYLQLYLINKKVISKEQLIGIVCGSTSVFFLIVGITICAVRKSVRGRSIYDIILSDTSNDMIPENNRVLSKDDDVETLYKIRG